MPRLGYVEFRRQQRDKGTFFILGLVLLLVIVVGGIFLLGALSLWEGTPSEPGESIDQYIWMAVSGIAAVIVVGAVLALRLRRLIVYAALTAIMVIAGFLLDINPAVYLLILGAVVLITGLVMLIRFLRKYPPIDGAIYSGGKHASAKQDNGQLDQVTESLADIDQTIHAPTRLKILAVLRVSNGLISPSF